MSLHQQHCLPSTTVTALTHQQLDDYLQLIPAWHVQSDGQLCRDFHFPAFTDTMRFINQVADMAEQQDHHPSMQINFRNCQLCFMTHAQHALTLNDFICAARAEQFYPY